MSTTRTVLDELLEPLGDCLTVETAERLSALRAPASVQARLDELARKSSDGRLSRAEREECEALVSAGTFISILKSRARRLLEAEKRAAPKATWRFGTMSELKVELLSDASADEARLLLAVALFDAGRLSLGRAAELANRSKKAFLDVLAEGGVPVFDYPASELEHESDV